MTPSLRMLVLALASLIPAFLTLVARPFVFFWWAALGLLFLGFLLDLALAGRGGRILVSRRPFPTLCHGREFRVEILVKNPGPYRLRGWVKDDVPRDFHVSGWILPVSVAPGESMVIGYGLKPLARGRHSFGSLFLRYRSPLGLLLFQKTFKAKESVRVFPDLEDLQRHRMLARCVCFSREGVKPLRFRGSGTEFASMRPYVQGDDSRRIDWKATAKHGKIFCRELEVERNHDIILAIDTGRLMASRIGGVPKLDQAVNASLALAGVSLENSDLVGLLLFSDRVKAFLTPAKVRGHLKAVVELLYDTRADPVETNFTRAFSFLADRQKKRALVVVITDVADRETSTGMIANVLLQARRHLFLFVAVRDPFVLETVNTPPETSKDAFLHAVTYDFMRERREVLQTLRKGGVHTLDLEPSEITAPLIGKYLEIRGRNLL